MCPMKGGCTISFIGRVRNGVPLISRSFHGRRRTYVDSLGTRRPSRQARTRRRVSTQGPPFPVIPFPDQAEMPAGSPGSGPSELSTPRTARTRHRHRVGRTPALGLPQTNTKGQ
jgi:hypothetical protein